MTFILIISAILIIIFSLGASWLLVDDTFNIENKTLKGVAFVLLSCLLLVLTSAFYTMLIWPPHIF
ncbi:MULTISPECIES: hypothetical protein [unclassified Candidatus Frackibacter]|uniref:hypothetical protein n=1 Tax=unclassified Candidatus Frackibacter TaxID=2648818 RepID=UPI000793E522|nr:MULTISPECIES: hypothetical protein [unclassified Candidatus Frackibacter]KXS38418.1 MAG: hypothetical protein AWU54_2222 [Candidatus Frackibacter sp. T328-2]SDC90014.1 hypothetical protein SAMN04515661_1422 [Candidatus Frackibacter sp. WG11]SEN04152.1 hypothetical protein SAMN04488698_1483 [Candidatus Frackibacter sp. WG12]SFM11827.1 hypothetical protein SAMN04488699_1443 [Candidatus Frackibacter sp. WG13]